MHDANKIESEALTISEVANLYGCHRRTVDNWIKSEDPPPSFTKSKVRLFIKSKLLKWKTPKVTRDGLEARS